jgi:hypothetical protein
MPSLTDTEMQIEATLFKILKIGREKESEFCTTPFATEVNGNVRSVVHTERYTYLSEDHSIVYVFQIILLSAMGIL